jgi:hypothetical protein
MLDGGLVRDGDAMLDGALGVVRIPELYQVFRLLVQVVWVERVELARRRVRYYFLMMS